MIPAEKEKEFMMANPMSRVNRSKDEARASYNRLSRWYDWLAGSAEEKYRKIGMELLAVQPAERVLEIGFGTGQCLAEFALTVGPSGRVFGIDLSDGMAAVARQRLKDSDAASRVDFALADAARIPFCEGYFDSIFMSFTLELFDSPEIPQVLDQCKRILRPTGRLALVTMIKTETPALPERIYEWFHARMPVLVDCRPILAQVALTQAGFVIDQVISESMWGLPVEIILAKQP
jgi:ubiquinone/menaquinone biosynthesis C-methylase UbiE